MRNYIQECMIVKYNVAINVARCIFDAEQADLLKSAICYCDGEISLADISRRAKELRKSFERNTIHSLVADVIDPEVGDGDLIEGLANEHARREALAQYSKYCNEHGLPIILTGVSPTFEDAYSKAKQDFLKEANEF